MTQISCRLLISYLVVGLLYACCWTHVLHAEVPNIVLLMAEDIGNDLSCYGRTDVSTPTLDELARNGQIYRSAICANPICSPNRSGMMVGVHPNILGAHMHRSNRTIPLKEPYKPFTYFLRKAGYTCLLGHEFVQTQGRKLDCNFKHEAVGPYDGVDNFGLFDEARSYQADDSPFFAQIQLQVTHRGDWWKQLRQNAKNPVSVDSVVLPPFIADTPKTRLDWANYLDTIEYMDNEVKLFMDDLRSKQLLDNTVVIFIGDNGRCNIRGKGYLHDTGIRVPIIISGPSHLVSKKDSQEIVSILDVTATILHLAGIDLPDYMEARSLIGNDQGPPLGYVYSARDGWDEINECIRSVTTKRFSYIRNYLPELPFDQHQAYQDFMRPAIHEMRRLKSELSEANKVFMSPTKPPEELYDLETDPDQMENLAEDPAYKSILDKHRMLMSEWQKKHKDLGLIDFKERKLYPHEPFFIRAWLQKNKPEEWEKYLNGEIGDSYKKWSQLANEDIK